MRCTTARRPWPADHPGAVRRGPARSGAGRLRGRPELLRRALEHVLHNAVRHTPPGTAVELDARAHPDAWCISVSDQGPSVAPERLEGLFEPFARGAGGGADLGLAIARRAVAAHGGRIEARNRPEGGLCVEIRLPLAAAGPGPLS